MSVLRALDRAADGRVRVYATELRVLLNTARTMGLSVLPVEVLEALADRMDGGAEITPESLDAWRAKKGEAR